MSQEKRDEWLVQILGNPNAQSWEISVVRKSNKHGQESWGWFDKDKILISHNGGPCRWAMAPGMGDIMIELAKKYADFLNSGNTNGDFFALSMLNGMQPLSETKEIRRHF